MRSIMLFVAGALLGLLLGSAVTLMVTPTSGRSLRTDVKNRFDSALEESRKAAEAKRRELEAELLTMTGVKLTVER